MAKIWGSLVDFATLGAQPISYLATGQSVSENLGMESVMDFDKKRDSMEGYLGGLASKQAYEARMMKEKLEQQGRPVQEAEVNRLQQLASLAKSYADQGMPEQAYQNAKQNIQQSTAGALGAATSRGGGLNSLGSIYGNQMSAFRDLASQDAMMQQQNQGGYLNALQMLSGAEGRAEGYNKLLPYEQQVAEYQAKLGAAQQNQFNQLMFGYQQGQANRQFVTDLTGAGIQATGQVAGAAIGASDARLKENMTVRGMSPSGIPIVTFSYLNDNKVYTGTTAQHLIAKGREDAVIEHYSGYYLVDYSKLDVEFKQIGTRNG